jgi:hypothetical protein
VGFPTLKKLTDTFEGNAEVAFLAVQTVFEGYSYNTEEKLRKNQLKYNVKVPMAHAAGSPQSHSPPEIMRNYRSGGTPWTVIIDPEGWVAYNNFHIEAESAAALIEKLLSQESKSLS